MKVTGLRPEKTTKFINYLIVSALLYPGFYSASNINEFHKQIYNISGQQTAAGVWGWQIHRQLWADFLRNIQRLTTL